MSEMTHSTTTALHDLGIEDADELSTKIYLVMQINRAIKSKRLNQKEAAKRMGITQPKVSLLKHYKIDGFSVEKLMTLLTALGKDVEIRVRNAPRSRAAKGKGKIRVAA